MTNEIFDVNFEEANLKKEIKSTEIPEQQYKISQDQLYDMLTSRELSWQAIILDLINTEQLDPMNVDLVLLTRKYIEKIRSMEELGEMNFFISSKVLYAASLLLRIKSASLRNNLQSIDEILFDRKPKIRPEDLEIKKLVEWNDDDLPLIMPRTPLPRSRKVTLVELMSALDTAMKTEQRRIKKHISWKRAQTDIDFAVFPKERKGLNLKEKLVELYDSVKNFFFKRKDNSQKLTFSMISGESKEEKIHTFIPLLHLDTQEKIWLEQPKNFDEIEIMLQEQYNELKKIREMEEKSLEELNEKYK